MAMIPHPITGLLINEIEEHRGTLSEKHKRTALLLLNEGFPRWLVGAKLGCHPLSFKNVRASRSNRRPRMGGNLHIRDARRDSRQMALDDWMQPTDKGAEG